MCKDRAERYGVEYEGAPGAQAGYGRRKFIEGEVGDVPFGSWADGLTNADLGLPAYDVAPRFRRRKDSEQEQPDGKDEPVEKAKESGWINKNLNPYF